MTRSAEAGRAAPLPDERRTVAPHEPALGLGGAAVGMPERTTAVATRSTIMDTNAYRADSGVPLSPRTAQAVARRQEVLGPSYRLFYRRPVHLVSGHGAHLVDADGADYLDVYNNVASVGHAHPRVAAAIAEQAATLNTHTRYLHDGIVGYGESLLALLPEQIDQVMFCCTGSEANDLAVRVAQAATGGTGVVVTAEAYHGNTALTSGMSPALGTAQPLGTDVRVVPAPDAYRLLLSDPATLGRWMADQVRTQIADLERHGIRFAAFLADSIFRLRRRAPRPGRVPAARRRGGAPGRGRVDRRRGAAGVRPDRGRVLGIRPPRGGAGPGDDGQADGQRHPDVGAGRAERGDGAVRRADPVLQHVRRQPRGDGRGAGRARRDPRRGAAAARRHGRRTAAHRACGTWRRTTPAWATCAGPGCTSASTWCRTR